jgi:UDP-glucose 6-dehydrogenase
MKVTVAGTSFTGCNNNTCFTKLWPQVNGTSIQEEKMNTVPKNIDIYIQTCPYVL